MHVGFGTVVFIVISNFVVYLRPKPFLYKNDSGTMYPIAEGIKGVSTAPTRISSKVNVIAWPEFDVTY